MLRSFLDEGSKDPGVAEYFVSEFHILRADLRAILLPRTPNSKGRSSIPSATPGSLGHGPIIGSHG